MTSPIKRILSLTLTLFLAGCSSLAPLLSPPTPLPTPQATATPPTVSPLPTPTADPHQPRLLRLWLPPQFDPQADTPAARLLNARLQAFTADHPGLTLDIRVKSGADILQILSLTNSAASAAMPDLIALPYRDMQKAASAGLLHPLEGLTTLLQDPDWYAFARELGTHKNIEYGIPFASDVLVITYQPAAFETPPASWEDVNTSGAVLAFPASDPQALFPLALYLSNNPTLTTEQGSVMLDEGALIRLFTFYRQMIARGIMPASIRDYQTDAQSLALYRNGQANMAVIWASSDLSTPSGNYLPLPGLESGHYTLGNGWVWALAGADVKNQPLAAELAAFLVESSFMAEWTRAAGFLPTRPQALNDWDSAAKTPLDEALQSAHPLPLEEVTAVVSPLFQEALMRLFRGEQPELVARSVMDALK
jgi:ABC-type glycerol-3-phosphate transport system substrate-binding protein